MHQFYKSKIAFTEEKIKAIVTEFDQFKEDNDIEAYFEKNLNSLERRKQLLKQIEEFTSLETGDVTIDKLKLEDLVDTNAASVLQDIISEYEKYRKVKIEIIATNIHREFVEFKPENP